MTVFAGGDELLLVSFVAEFPGFLPGLLDGRGRRGIHPIAVPELPVFAMGVNDIQGGHFDRSHPLVPAGETGATLEAVMGAAFIFLDDIVGEVTDIFFAAGQLTVLDAKPLRIPAESVVDYALTKGRG